MRHALTSVLSGLALAILAAAIVVAVAGVPIAASGSEQSMPEIFLAEFLAVAAFAFVPAFAAIALAEARRVQGLPYWLAVGGVTALVGFVWLWARSTERMPPSAAFTALAEFLAAGLLAGWIYWHRAGRRSGRIAIALVKAAETPLGPELSASRCRFCTAIVLLLGLIPLSLAASFAIYGGSARLASAVTAQSEKDARLRLDQAGLQYLSVTFDDDVATVGGRVPQGTTADAAFAEAKNVLAPLVGIPGIVARLDNAVATETQTTP